MDGNPITSVGCTAPSGTAGASAGWSRRRFVAQGLLTVAATVPSLARAVTGPAVEAPPNLTTQKAAATDPGQYAGSGAVRSASDTDSRLTTLVFLNGAGPYHFLVDTGAERTLIAEDIATRLALPRGRDVMVEGIIRGQAAHFVNIERLEMGGLVCPHLEVPVLPRAMMTVDGYLGLDVLDERRVIFDFRAGTLTVTRAQGFFSSLWTHGDEAVVRTLGTSGRLRATNCLVNGVRAAAFVDTGAEVSVSNPALYAALRRRAANRQVLHGEVGLYGVTGGKVTGLDTNVDEIRLDRLELTYTELVVAALEVFDLWGLSEEPALLLGMDCLQRFSRVSIDYGRKELRFEIASAQPAQPLQARLRGPLLG
jgi:predicted aspartyl protease